MTSRSKNEAANYGYKKMIEHDVRYERAQEHLQVCCALWDSIEPDAIVLDRENGIFGDPAKVHLLNFEGEYYSVRGPLPALPLAAAPAGDHPGRPVRAGHGSRRALRRPAIFSTRRTIAEHEGASRRTRWPRSPSSAAQPRDCGILWSVRIQVADSEDEARAMEEHYLEFDSAGSRTDRAVIDVWARFLTVPPRYAAGPTSPPK